MTRREFGRALLVGGAAVIGAPVAKAYTPSNLVCVGDSWTYGYNSAAGGAQQAQNYPLLLGQLLPGSTVINYGVSGRKLGPWGPSEPDPGTMASLLNTAGSSAPHTVNFYLSGSLPNIAVIIGGANDLTQEDDINVVKAGFSTLCANYRSAGWTTWIFTVPSRTWPFNPTAVEATRATLNTYIRANASQYDALIDIAADSRFSAGYGSGSPSFNNTKYYEGDQIHWSVATNFIVARSVAARLGVRAIFPFPGGNPEILS